VHGKILAKDDRMRSAKITRLLPGDRPREKLERGDPTALGDNELLALVIGHGTAGVDALAIGEGLLGAAGGVHGLTRLSHAALCTLPGVGPAMACRIKAAVELGRRTVQEPAGRAQLTSGAAVRDFLLPRYGGYPVERFGVILVDTKLRVLRAHIVSYGALDAVVAHPREVFREATIAGAAGIIAFHNHPSGDPEPSDDDVRVTIRLARAGEIIGVELFDHVILGDGRYCSLRESRYPPWAR
jgi:DNA repair protein RadC